MTEGDDALLLEVAQDASTSDLKGVGSRRYGYPHQHLAAILVPRRASGLEAAPLNVRAGAGNAIVGPRKG
jgi:hypothetical protein